MIAMFNGSNGAVPFSGSSAEAQSEPDGDSDGVVESGDYIEVAGTYSPPHDDDVGENGDIAAFENAGKGVVFSIYCHSTTYELAIVSLLQI